jgi:hypothetical protein
MEDAIRKVPALQGQVNVLEQLDQEVVQSRENHLPLLNGVAVSDATSVVLPEKGSKLETKIFSIGARDVGWIGFFKGTHVQTPAFADGAKILLSSL